MPTFRVVVSSCEPEPDPLAEDDESLALPHPAAASAAVVTSASAVTRNVEMPTISLPCRTMSSRTPVSAQLPVLRLVGDERRDRPPLHHVVEVRGDGRIRADGVPISREGLERGLHG